MTTGWGWDGGGPQPTLASWVGSPISEPCSCFFNPTSSPKGGKHPARAPFLFIPDLSPVLPVAPDPCSPLCPLQLLLFPPSEPGRCGGVCRLPGGWMTPQHSRAALKATKAGIWLQKPGGRGQTLTLVTTESTALQDPPWHPLQVPPVAAEGAAGVDREKEMFKTSPSFWDGSAWCCWICPGSQRHGGRAAQCPASHRACRDRPQDVIYSNQ